MSVNKLIEIIPNIFKMQKMIINTSNVANAIVCNVNFYFDFNKNPKSKFDKLAKNCDTINSY